MSIDAWRLVMGARNVGVHRCVWVKEGSMKNAGGLRLEQTIEFVNLLFYSESEKVKPSHFSFARYFYCFGGFSLGCYVCWTGERLVPSISCVIVFTRRLLTRIGRRFRRTRNRRSCLHTSWITTAARVSGCSTQLAAQVLETFSCFKSLELCVISKTFPWICRTCFRNET